MKQLQMLLRFLLGNTSPSKEEQRLQELRELSRYAQVQVTKDELESSQDSSYQEFLERAASYRGIVRLFGSADDDFLAGKGTDPISILASRWHYHTILRLYLKSLHADIHRVAEDRIRSGFDLGCVMRDLKSADRKMLVLQILSYQRLLSFDVQVMATRTINQLCATWLTPLRPIAL